MNWSLVTILSGFGLVMALATVSLIPPTVEPVLWLIIFVFCAVVVARRAPSRFFLHGLAIGILNSIWVTAAHVAFFDTFVAHHPDQAAMSASMPLSNHPRALMVIVGPVIGVATGLILGVFCLVAARVRRR